MGGGGECWRRGGEGKYSYQYLSSLTSTPLLLSIKKNNPRNSLIHDSMLLFFCLEIPSFFLLQL